MSKTDSVRQKINSWESILDNNYLIRNIFMPKNINAISKKRHFFRIYRRIAMTYEN